jgi:molecular chaperone GrpE
MSVRPDPRPEENAAGQTDHAPREGEGGASGVAENLTHEDDAAAKASRLEAEIADLKDRLLRALAEQENIRLRSRRDAQEAAKFASFAFAKEILTVADNLRRAMQNFPESGAAREAVAPLLEGIEATERGLQNTLEKHGITRLEPLGEDFDANFHAVVLQRPDTGKPEGTVVDVLEPGYLYNGRLLRPALVNIAKD